MIKIFILSLLLSGCSGSSSSANESNHESDYTHYKFAKCYGRNNWHFCEIKIGKHKYCRDTLGESGVNISCKIIDEIKKMRGEERYD